MNTRLSEGLPRSPSGLELLSVLMAPISSERPRRSEERKTELLKSCCLYTWPSEVARYDSREVRSCSTLATCLSPLAAISSPHTLFSSSEVPEQVDRHRGSG